MKPEHKPTLEELLRLGGLLTDLDNARLEGRAGRWFDELSDADFEYLMRVLWSTYADWFETTLGKRGRPTDHDKARHLRRAAFEVLKRVSAGVAEKNAKNDVAEECGISIHALNRAVTALRTDT